MGMIGIHWATAGKGLLERGLRIDALDGMSYFFSGFFFFFSLFSFSFSFFFFFFFSFFFFFFFFSFFSFFPLLEKKKGKSFFKIPFYFYLIISLFLKQKN